MNPLLGSFPVADEEFLARFVVESNRFRKSDNTAKPEAFMPHPHIDLSITRHRDLIESEIWDLGKDVANHQKKTLYGRADIRAASVRTQRLTIDPAPVANNPNHANIKGWPREKSAQKDIALQLAAASIFTPFSPSTPAD
jgi:hypothetical protein